MSKKINIYKTIEELGYENNEFFKNVDYDVVVALSEIGTCYEFDVEYDEEQDEDYYDLYKKAVDDALEGGGIYIARYTGNDIGVDFGFIIDKDYNFTFARRVYGTFVRGDFCEKIMDVTEFINDPTLIVKIADLINYVIYD